MWHFLWLFFLKGVLCDENALIINPGSLTAWKGSCVLIPCEIKTHFNKFKLKNISLIWYSNPIWDTDLKEFNGTMLYNGSTTTVSYMRSANPTFQHRVSFTGDLHNKNCSLKISQIQGSDCNFGARLYGYDQYTFQLHKWFLSASVKVSDSPPKPKIMLHPEQIQERKITQVKCSVSYHCPDEPVMVILSGLENKRGFRQPETYVDRVAQTKLSFRPTWKDHRKQLTCVLKSHNGTELSQNTVELNVKHAPTGIQLNATPGVTIQEGKKLSLKCMVNSSYPAVSHYQWYKNGNQRYEGMDKDKIEFNPIQEQDSGRYKCEAKNQLGSDQSKELTIDVQYPPKETKVICSVYDGHVKEKEQVVLQCSSKGNPPLSHFEWYKLNEPSAINNHEELRFETIQPSDSSTYFCKAYNNIGNSTSPPFTLDVKYGPKDVRLAILNNLPIKEGDNISFNCSVGSSNPTISMYKFLRSTSHMAVSSKLPVITFSAKPEPTTSYKCEACNAITCTTSTAVTVDVHFAPKEVKAVQNPPGPINEGSSVKLICEVGRANPRDFTYIWYKDTHQMIHATDIQLTIQEVTARHAGSYHCKVENSVGMSHSSPVFLDVHYGPRDIHVSLNIQEAIIEGKDVSLRCENDANPSANIYSWYWNGKEIAQKTTQILKLRKIQVGQSGDYFCKVSNQVAEGESLPMALIVFYSRATVIKHTLTGLGTVLALIILLGLLIYGLQRWKKNIDSATGGTQRSSSFFVKKAKGEKLCNNNNGGNEEETDGSLGFLNHGPEGSITYATVQFPPSFSDGRVVYASIKQPRVADDPCEESVIYSVVKKPGLPTKEDTKPDYENVNKMEDEVHYSSLVNLAPKPVPTYMDAETDSESEDSIHYAALKH